MKVMVPKVLILEEEFDIEETPYNLRQLASIIEATLKVKNDKEEIDKWIKRIVTISK